MDKWEYHVEAGPTDWGGDPPDAYSGRLGRLGVGGIRVVRRLEQLYEHADIGRPVFRGTQALRELLVSDSGADCFDQASSGFLLKFGPFEFTPG